MFDVTPRALKTIRKAVKDNGGQAVRVVFQGFG